MECMDCGDEITGKRLLAIEVGELEERCIPCQEQAHREGRARGPRFHPAALAAISEPDSFTRAREAGWPEDHLLPKDRKESEAA